MFAINLQSIYSFGSLQTNWNDKRILRFISIPNCQWMNIAQTQKPKSCSSKETVLGTGSYFTWYFTRSTLVGTNGEQDSFLGVGMASISITSIGRVSAWSLAAREAPACLPVRLMRRIQTSVWPSITYYVNPVYIYREREVHFYITFPDDGELEKYMHKYIHTNKTVATRAFLTYHSYDAFWNQWLNFTVLSLKILYLIMDIFQWMTQVSLQKCISNQSLFPSQNKFMDLAYGVITLGFQGLKLLLHCCLFLLHPEHGGCCRN